MALVEANALSAFDCFSSTLEIPRSVLLDSWRILVERGEELTNTSIDLSRIVAHVVVGNSEIGGLFIDERYILSQSSSAPSASRGSPIFQASDRPSAESWPHGKSQGSGESR